MTYKYTHILSTILLVVGVALCLWAGVKVLNTIDIRQGIDNSVDSGYSFDINDFHVELDVDEHKSVQVQEKIDVNFHYDYNHGIYRFIPEWLIYTAKDGKATSHRYKISDLKCSGEKYEVDTIKGKQRIKIGDPNIYLDAGPHTYNISYTYDMGTDPYDGFDEFIFHAYGDYWGPSIDHSSITINFPKELPEDTKVHFFTDKTRHWDDTDKVTYQINGSTLTASYNDVLYRSLTVDVELPEGYFEEGSNNYGYVALIICILCLVAGIVFFILWVLNGRDFKEYAEEIVFNAHDNLDAAEIGYAYKKATGRKLTIALIISLAAKGYITIRTSADAKSIKVEREKGADTFLSANELLVYRQLFSSGSSTDLATNKTFYQVFNQVDKCVVSSLEEKIHDMKSAKLKLYSGLCLVINVILLKLAYCNIEDLNPKLNYLYLLAAIGLALHIFATIVMERKTQYGEDLFNRIKAFRNYLIEVDKNQINNYTENNPNYIYELMAYAYVLDVSKIWINKFDIPNDPAFDYIYNMDNYYNYVYTPARSSSSSSSSSSSGCSSCGGGCSSCGGGCSSCGGGGSW
ncbi:Predicted membrane protein [Pseudobutyrivibrio sp. YE44]|uniref:DUF2207 domain-containing protein n=1 Tax=Pseudobutyrivibrio sp. YE44 TaxID=1520802 RepID=UPI00088B104B|nr:DUF2207 domain-containing protein [Pseudobutyrivibrio sp. YE44]SDB14988.1 Predicted membrane protein [Pseudobutyrivibrio sp. YE44]